MNASAAIDDPLCEASQIRETSFVKREAFSLQNRMFPFPACQALHASRDTLHARAGYCRLSATITALFSVPQVR